MAAQTTETSKKEQLIGGVVLFIIIAIFFKACGSSAPFKVEILESYNPLLYQNVKSLKITATEDGVQITDIIPNRGKCSVGGILVSPNDDRLYKKLDKGESWSVPLVRCKTINEIRIYTDEDEYDFSF